ncbi:MAG: hypothetical protein HY869_20580 [Chloroflexi bacterium]|nr:hypothetical protein [Chloroflexota bacterium]
MPKPIDELVRMHDIETLYELMAEDEDWMIQLDAAEGLVKLNDRRGYEFLLSASQSEDEEVRDVAREILADPAMRDMKAQMDAEFARERQVHFDVAKKRLQKGARVFRYKMVYLPAGEIMSEDPLSQGFDVPALDDLGLEGWEVVNMLPRRSAVLVGSMDDHFVGAYFLLKREVHADEAAELQK